jgi:hypothetical protein
MNSIRSLLPCYRYRINVLTIFPLGSMSWTQNPLRCVPPCVGRVQVLSSRRTPPELRHKSVSHLEHSLSCYSEFREGAVKSADIDRSLENCLKGGL